MNILSKLCIIVVLLVMFVSGVNATWTIDGDKVYIDDTNVYLSAEPHTLGCSCWVTFNVTPKLYSGDIDVIWGFNTTEAQPKLPQLFHPHWDNWTTNHSRFFLNVTNIEVSSESCEIGNEYNTYKRNATYYVCSEWNATTMECEAYNLTDAILCFDSFVQDDANYTIDWHTNYSRIVNWLDIRDKFSHIQYEYQNMTDWYLTTDIPVVAGNSYQVRAWIEVPVTLEGSSGKYWWAIKPSSETMAQAIANGHLYCLDPWWSASWNKKRELKINNTGGSALTYYQVYVNLTDTPINETSLRVVNETVGAVVPHWCESITSNNCTKLWFNATSLPNAAWLNDTYYIYYDNAAASSVSNGTNTFAFFDDFPGSSIDTGKWEDETAYASVSNSILTYGPGTHSMNTKTEFGTGIALRANRRMTTPASNWLIFGLGPPSPGGVNVLISIFAHDSISQRFYDADSGETISTNWSSGSYKTIEIRRDTNISWFEETVERSNSPYTTIANIPTVDIPIVFYPCTPNYVYADWVLIRKCASPDPSTTLGSEEDATALHIDNAINIKEDWGMDFDSNLSANVTGANCSDVWMNFTNAEFTNTSLGWVNLTLDEWVNDSHNVNEPVSNVSIDVTLNSTTLGAINDTDSFYYEITKRTNTATMDSTATQNVDTSETFYVNATCNEEYGDTFIGSAYLLEDGSAIDADGVTTGYVNFSWSEASAGQYNYTVEFYNNTHYNSATTPTYSNVTVSCNNYVLVNPGDSIQVAINSICSGGGTVELAPGLHNVTNTVVINKSNILLNGTSSATVKHHNKTVCCFLIPEEGSRLTNITLDGFNTTSTYTSGDNAQNDFVQAVYVESFFVKNMYDTSEAKVFVHVWGTAAGRSRNVTIDNNTLENCGVVATKITNMYVTNNTILGSRHDYALATDEHITNLNVIGNRVINAGANSALLVDAPHNCIVRDNFVHGSKVGININQPVQNAIIENNTIKNCWENGIVLRPQTAMHNVTIKNNYIFNCTKHGIVVSWYGYSMVGYSDVNITNNVIYNNGLDGIIKASEWWASVIIKNNIITNNARCGINLTKADNVTHSYNDIWNNTNNYNGTIEGTGEIHSDPLFYNIASNDHHLNSTIGTWNGTDWEVMGVHSPCIDTGDPMSTYTNEPAPNGSRINMGAYGNTMEASKSSIDGEYIPPDPTGLANTTGYYWVNYTWVIGTPGNVTDSYNVSWNDTWYNGTSDTFMKKEVGASNWANITVYAYNSSGNGSLSAGSVSDNVQAPAFVPGDYIPPNPTTLLNSTGNYYVNYTWVMGVPGNITDSYNVSWNLSWFNGTLTTYMQKEVGASNWGNITVYAYNSSGNGTLSSGSLSDDVQAPAYVPGEYPPATPTSLANSTGNGWVNCTWSSGGGANVTDSYNVSWNLTWYNTTLVTYRNDTVGEFGWANITVYAFNASGSGSLSAGSLSNDTQAGGGTYTTSMTTSVYNLVSYYGSANSSAEQFGDDITNVDYVARYNNVNNTFTTHIMGTGGNNFTTVHGRGYFVYVNVSGSSTYNRNNISDSAYYTNLSTGWDTIGWTNATDTNAEGLISSLGSACKYTSMLNVDGLSYTTHTSGFSINNHVVNKGKGYWVWVNTNTNWNRNS